MKGKMELLTNFKKKLDPNGRNVAEKKFEVYAIFLS
jgi:hypothetical protein